ncbi:type IV secretory system conjugative DNA transfer family protein [Pseudomonas helleri]|uniref:Uncharacterized protein n=1 Tax=Pseudomonas helleri TaxID=1608996 RepID=A0A7X2C5D6_9PSED|nr:hypothetical protein [Pseudomonas helleri]MQT91761.1 hypothetical protein [Pseudomonas helleri]MQT97258.1 hypothetical protein [Pseudomonas helleri]MQU32563.1 hypothetical protein [Pseudomonas helleri]
MNNAENPMADVATGGHVLVLDERITGQEQLIAGMLGKQISAGGAVIVLGASIEEPMLATLLNACHLAGREADLLVVNPAKPATSHTYNPVLHSSPASIASQVMNFIANQDDSGETSDGGTARLLEAIIACLQLGNIPYSFLDLGMFVMKPDAIAALGEFIGQAHPGSEALRAFDAALQPFRDAEGNISPSLLKAKYSGLAGSMCMLGTGRLGEIFNSYKPDLVLHDAIASSKVIYLAAPYIGRGAAASNLRRIVIANLADAVGRLAESDPAPKVPALALFTDAGGCNDPCVERLLAAESEGVLRVWISSPSLDDLGRESIDLREVCLSRARSLVFFRPNTEATAQLYLKFLNQDGAPGTGALVERMLALSSTQYVAVTDGSQVQWGDARAPQLETQRSAVVLPRPERFFHEPLTGADQFTQTVPV